MGPGPSSVWELIGSLDLSLARFFINLGESGTSIPPPRLVAVYWSCLDVDSQSEGATHRKSALPGDLRVQSNIVIQSYTCGPPRPRLNKDT